MVHSLDSTSTPAVPECGRFLVAVEAQLLPHLPAAATRLGYLYPELVFETVPEGMAITGSLDISVVRRELLHQVYRERIFAETLPLRRTLIDGLLAR